MPRPIIWTGTPTALDRDGITAAVTPTGADTLNIDGALATPAFDRDGIVTAHTPSAGTIDIAANLGAVGYSFAADTRIAIYAAGDQSGVTFTLWGHAANGAVVTETIAGPNAGSVYSANLYRELRRVNVDTAPSGDIEIGPLGAVVFATPMYVTTYAATAADNITFTGTDRQGNAITETVAVATTTTTTSTRNFATVNQVTIDGAATGVELGVDGTFDSGWLGVDRYANEFNVGVSVDYGTTGTYQVETTGSNIYAAGFDESTAQVAAIAENPSGTALANIGADAVAATTAPVYGIRIRASAAATGQISMQLIQTG